MQTAFLIIYTIFYTLAVLFLLPREYLKRPAELKNRWLREKFGFFKKSFPHSSAGNNKLKIWIHAVSVGEVIAVSGLVKKLAENHEIILSTITDTGQKVALQRFKNYPVKVIYLPFDMPWTIRKTLKFFKPSLLILTETELWPNLIFICSNKIPVILVNGRLSEKSFRGYSKLKIFMKSLLSKIKIICVQEDIYKKRFISLGVEEKKIHITGNMKFDLELKAIPFRWEDYIPKPVLLAGSTHEPEEKIIIDAFLKLGINGTLIIAPRHPERLREVETLIREKIIESKREILFLRLSEIYETSKPFSIPLKNLQSSVSVILVDQMGILGSLYRVCDLAIIGGSFIPHGGQNPLEPAYWKKPIICGPHMYNFPFIEEFIKEKACIMVTQDRLQDSVRELIENPEIMISTGIKAHEIFSKKSGATERTLKILRELTFSL